MLKNGNYSVKAIGKSTEELKKLKLDGFEVREGEFDGYPVPVWTPAAAPEPITPPAPAFSCVLTFTGAEDGDLTLKHGEDVLTANENGDYAYTLSEAGDYSYSVAFGADSDYNDIPETGFTVGEDETAKTIAVPLTYKTTEPSGTGTKESPYLIGTAEELRWFANKVNSGDSAAAHAYVKLTDNIIVPGSWTPLGKNTDSPFSGHFDGQGHSVTITVDDPGPSYFGFFGCLNSKPDRDSTTPMDEQPTVVVENLTVNGTVYCSEPGAYVGGIAARARGKVEIKNCVNNATVSSLARGSAGVGGLVGSYDDGVEYVYKNIRMTVDGCKNNGTIIVTGTNTDAKVGGLVGANANCVQVKNSKNTATINAPGCTVGGLLGEAGYQTGDFKPAIQDSSNTGILIGAEGKTNNLYGKGTIRSGYLINSGSNTYTGGSESEDELLKESRKYNDVLAVPATAEKDYEITLLKSGEAADKGITVTCSVGERDTNKDYLKVVDGKLQLAKKNDTGKVIEATATITWSKGDQTLSKPITVNIYPAAKGETSARKALMEAIAKTYRNKSEDWVVFDMAAYAKCGFGDNTTDTENYLNLTINELAGTSPLATDRAKAEIILAALGIDSTKLTPLDGAEYSNAAKLAAMNLGTSHYTAPWVLLAEQAGQLKLTDAQRANMIALLTDSANLGKDGLFFTKWAGETYADPDTTGTALTALAAYADRAAVKSFIDKAVAGLSKAQNSNGSYGNVNSDAMVIIGLAAVGIDPASDERFVKGGCSLADALLLYVNDGQNGFTAGYISGTQGEKAQALATEQGFRALVTLEQFAKDTSKAFNIYTLSTAPVSSTDPDNPDTPGQPAQPEQPQPGTATGSGTLPSEGGSTGGGSTGGSGKSWISVAVSIEPGSGSAWYSGSVRVAEGATVEQALETAAAQAGLILNIKDGYLRAVIRSGVTLGQYDEGPNSGWLYKVSGKAPNVGIADYRLNGGETVTVYYTADYTKESGLDISAPASGGAVGKTETVTNADGSVTKIETKSDGTVIETTTWRDGSTLTAETSPNGRVETVEKRADGTTVETVESASGGITASVSVPKSVGSTRVDIPVSKPSGSMVAVIVHPDGTEEIVKGSIVTETGIALRAEGNVRLKIIDNAKRFNDMADHWAKDAVEFASSRELFNGVGNDAFGPDLSMTRGMVSTVLARLAGADTAGGETWYAKGTVWAVENGISDGTAPEQPVTREQLAAMLYRYAGSPTVSGELSFDDTTVISIWAYDAVRWCVDNGILNGVGGNRMTPQDLARRGQVAAMLMRFLQATV
ncbi:MAG: S-layer homology domain-containing protein [Firmicutes bacterium]|nr:S-layer homology domain-containing protein [Bacillota bacterium]